MVCRLKPLGDLIWTLPPLTAFLYALGGWGISKGIRRIGIPLAITVYAVLYYRKTLKRHWPWLIALFFAIWGVLTLPLTLIGDSMASKVNILWAFAVGGLNVACLYPLTHLSRVPNERLDQRIKFNQWQAGMLVASIVYGLLVIFSNTISAFEHKWTEIAAGFFIGWMAALLIGKD